MGDDGVSLEGGDDGTVARPAACTGSACRKLRPEPRAQWDWRPPGEWRTPAGGTSQMPDG